MRSHVRGSVVAIAMASIGLLAASPVATAATINLRGTLVAQATSPTPTGSGSATIDIDTVARTLVFQSTYQGLNNNVSASHIHAQATASPYVFPSGANWTVALNFSGSPSSTGPSAAPATFGPTTYTPASLSAGFVTAQGGNANTAFDNFVTFLSTGQAYYNLHTSLNTPNAGAGNAGGSMGTFFTAVPEIDPTSFGSVLALLTGSLGLLERRTRRLRLTTTG
ncbi:MAG: CHRD domain-containing protein [Planctomycetia bacterium]